MIGIIVMMAVLGNWIVESAATVDALGGMQLGTIILMKMSLQIR